jgi:hypothetical protein
LSGILPFGAAFVELYFVLSSLFASRAYYAFGFLALTAGVVALTTATVTILFTYFILCAEEYRWHWRAFFTGGGSAFWLLAYGLFYWATRLSLGSVSSVILSLGYLRLLGILDFLVTGMSPRVVFSRRSLTSGIQGRLDSLPRIGPCGDYIARFALTRSNGLRVHGTLDTVIQRLLGCFARNSERNATRYLFL